jgi:hypothetical protein
MVARLEKRAISYGQTSLTWLNEVDLGVLVDNA